MNPITIKILVALGVAALLFVSGYGLEYKHMVEYKAEQRGVAEAQVTLVKNLNATIDTNAKDSNENIINTAKSIADYYKSHPVIRLQNDGSCSVPQANSSAPSTDGSTTSKYISAYSPELTEQIANELDLLQKLLIKDGVEVK
jgi:hypothetical protein